MPVALAQSVVTAPRATKAAQDRLRKERNGVRFLVHHSHPPTPIDSESSAMAIFPRVQAQELVQGFQTPCSLGFSGMHFQQLPFSALTLPQVKPFGSH